MTERRKRSDITKTPADPALPPPPTPELPPGFDGGAALAVELKKNEPTQPDPLGITKKAGDVPQMHEHFERIVTTQWVKEAFDEYQRLDGLLHIGEERGNYATVNTHMDHAETNSRKAFKLWLAGEIESARFEKDAEVVTAAMWAAATRELQAEKEDGKRNKAITDADVRAMCAQMYPDEYRAIENKRTEVKLMVENLKDLNQAWKSRCKTLQTMLSALRK